MYVLRMNVNAGALGALCKAPSRFTRSRARPGWGALCKASQGGDVLWYCCSGCREGGPNSLPLSLPVSCETGSVRCPPNGLWEAEGGPPNGLWARSDRLGTIACFEAAGWGGDFSWKCPVWFLLIYGCGCLRNSCKFRGELILRQWLNP